MLESGPPLISSERPRRFADGIAVAKRRTLCSTSGGRPASLGQRDLLARVLVLAHAGEDPRQFEPRRVGIRAARREGREAPRPRPRGRPFSRATRPAGSELRREARDACPGSALRAPRPRRNSRRLRRACRRARRAAPRWPGRNFLGLDADVAVADDGSREGSAARRISIVQRKQKDGGMAPPSSVRADQLPTMAPTRLPPLPRRWNRPPTSCARAVEIAVHVHRIAAAVGRA